MRRVFALAAAALTITACGPSQKEEPAQLAPAKALFYAETTLRPEGEQKDAINRIVGRFPGSGDAGQRIGRLLERGLREEGGRLSYEQDVKPWLGDSAAAFGAGPLRGGELRSVALLIAAEDEGKAMDAVEKASKGELGPEREYEGKSYRRVEDGVAGTVDGFLVLGTEQGFKAAVDAAKGDQTIDRSSAYDKALEGVPQDRLATFFLNSPELARQQRSLGAAGESVRKLLRDPYVTALKADDDGLELSAALPESIAGFTGPLLGAGSKLLAELPADSWAALAQPKLGDTLDRYVELAGSAVGGRALLEQQVRAATGLDLERDIVGWMGDFALFARGTTVASLDGALMIETSDPAASKRALAALERLLRREEEISVGGLRAPGGGDGFTVRVPGAPKPVHAFQRSGRVVFAYGDEAARAALSPGDTLSGSADFEAASRALGSDFQVASYVAIGPILELAESAGASGSDFDEARRYLEAFRALVAGNRDQGGKLLSRLRLTTAD